MAYVLLLPLIRFFIQRTRRAYVLILCEGEILLIKNWLARQDWGLPGGGVHKKEEPRDAAVREVKEETGLDLRVSLELMAQGRWKADRLGHEYLIFLARLPSKETITSRQFEIIAAEWVPLNRIVQYDISPDLVKVISNYLEEKDV